MPRHDTPPVEQMAVETHQRPVADRCLLVASERRLRDGKHASGGTFKLHAARRGAPVRCTGLRTVRLNPSP